MSVVMTWLVNSLIVAVVLTAGAAAWEAAARWSGRPARWGWLAALVGSVSVPWIVRLLPARTWADIPVGMPMLTLDALEVTAQTQSPGWSLVDAALVSWCVASLLMVAYLARVVAELARARRGWREAEVEGGRVYVTRDTGPAALGVRRGMVVVPAWALQLDADLRTLLLQHEREHVRAGDPRLLLGCLLLVAAMPWNPVLWAQLLRLRNAIELDCDSRVLASGADPERYGSLLLEVGRHRSGGAPVMATFAEPRVFLRQRIRRIAQWPLERRPARAATLAFVAALLFASALSARDPRAGGNVKDAMHDDDVAATALFVEQRSTMAVDTPPTTPHFTPMTERPQLLNREGVQRALIASYPPLLKDAGIDGSAIVWLYIDETGKVTTTQLKESSGYLDLDRAALEVAAVMEFSPAKNRGEVTAVWVEIPIQFGPTRSGPGSTAETGSVTVGPKKLPPPPAPRQAASRAELLAGPSFTPMTIRPELKNKDEVRRALVRYYPPLLRDAGIGGSPLIWFFIDEQGTVAQTQLNESSGYPDLDEAALRVAATMQFTPAMNGDETVPVWVEIPIQFSAK